MTTDIDNNRPACYIPWVTSYEYNTGNITPCCEWTGPYFIKTKEHMPLEDRFNHPKNKELQQQLLACDNNNPDALPSGCKQCKELEKAGGKSMRQSVTQTVESAELTSSYKWHPEEYKQVWLDYRESNLCNFSCKMCGEDLSSTHAKILGVYGKKGIIKNPHRLQMYLDRLDEVKFVQFLGGEPVLTDSMYIILKEIRKRNLQHQMDMNITTNGSLLHRDSDSLLELCEGFKSVQIAISIDAMGDQHDYWRQKGTWDIVWKNTLEIEKWVHTQSNADMKIRTAIAWPNAYAARDVFDAFADKLSNNKVSHVWNLVNIPEGLDLNQLSQDTLDKLTTWWSKYPDVAHMFSKIKPIEDNRYAQEWKSHLGIRYDNWHKNNFVDAFPEFKEFYNGL
jgi:sulfatase maturation enzyme AslB (radical SAM superfamily)